MEQDIDGEEKARGQLTGELRIKKTQHMTTSRFVPNTYTVVEISSLYFVLLYYSYKSWTIIKTRVSFEICWF